MKLKPLRTGQPATYGGPPLDGDLYRWLASLMTAVTLSVPPKGIVMAYLTAAEVTANFSATGLGNVPGKYEGWAICNGSNDTPNLTDRFIRSKVTGAGATGGSDSSAHTHAIDHNHAAVTSAANNNGQVITDGGGIPFAYALDGHTHSVDVAALTGDSGAASATENRPAYYELVPLMRLEVV